jgi:hypothetical protein
LLSPSTRAKKLGRANFAKKTIQDQDELDRGREKRSRRWRDDLRRMKDFEDAGPAKINGRTIPKTNVNPSTCISENCNAISGATEPSFWSIEIALANFHITDHLYGRTEMMPSTGRIFAGKILDRQKQVG